MGYSPTMNIKASRTCGGVARHVYSDSLTMQGTILRLAWRSRGGLSDIIFSHPRENSAPRKLLGGAAMP